MLRVCSVFSWLVLKNHFEKLGISFPGREMLRSSNNICIGPLAPPPRYPFGQTVCEWGNRPTAGIVWDGL